MTSLSIALAAVIHVGVALTSKCGLLNVTHTAAVVQVPMSRTNPGSSPNQSGRLSNMATTLQISKTHEQRANALSF